MKKFFIAILSLLATTEIFKCNPVDNSPLIVGGFPANIADFPHSLALLDLVRGGPTGYICGASIFHRKFSFFPLVIAFNQIPHQNRFNFMGVQLPDSLEAANFSSPATSFIQTTLGSLSTTTLLFSKFL